MICEGTYKRRPTRRPTPAPPLLFAPRYSVPPHPDHCPHPAPASIPRSIPTHIAMSSGRMAGRQPPETGSAQRSSSTPF